MRRILLASAFLGMAVTSGFAQDVKQVDCCTGGLGGEAAALNVLKDDLGKEGFTWKDVPWPRRRRPAMVALKAMVRPAIPDRLADAGLLGARYAEAGTMADLTETAIAEGWDKAVPPRCRSFRL
jgi:glucose/mannose transport system substrate-binding protein